MITAFLTMTVVWLLFYGRIPSPTLTVVCVVFGIALALFGKHRHTQFLTIDVLAQISRLNRVNPSLKFLTVLVLMALCVSSRSPVTGIFLTAVMLVLTVVIGGLKLRDYIHLLALPVSFLMISGLALLFEVTEQCTGVFGIHIFGFWICVSAGAQARAALVTARALGAVSCLYFLSLTTPMPELIGVLRRARCPDVLIELMYLIYRYIFVLLSMYHTMRDAAKSRLGFVDYRTSMHTMGNLYSNLLSRSYRQANKNFDAMESRCYDTEIRFLEHREKVTGLQTAVAVSITVLTLSLTLLVR